ncbi:MAG: hypothetical protein AAFR76_01305 [Planctomycetota bacterium]
MTPFAFALWTAAITPALDATAATRVEPNAPGVVHEARSLSSAANLGIRAAREHGVAYTVLAESERLHLIADAGTIDRIRSGHSDTPWFPGDGGESGGVYFMRAGGMIIDAYTGELVPVYRPTVVIIESRNAPSSCKIRCSEGFNACCQSLIIATCACVPTEAISQHDCNAGGEGAIGCSVGWH